MWANFFMVLNKEQELNIIRMVHIMWEIFQEVIKMGSAVFMSKILKNLGYG